jgi:hypothetical protein
MHPRLQEHGITPGHDGIRISTLARLREQAQARNITITGITKQKPQIAEYRDDTPETAN